mmetsp:Transcript_43923/g.73203  ORF Transcript_43923/g.73203 Transcript_43923/m.73203 type:complete len:439 (-) Transcript_43923:407-1723(-)
MGIQNLLQQLKSVSNELHVQEYRGRKVAVDGYSWLHKGVYGCALELARNIRTDKYVSFFMGRVHILTSNGVIPVIVFDGDKLPAKSGEERDRAEERARQKARGDLLFEEGKRTEAYECYAKSIDVNPFMAYQVIRALQREGIEYIVAPYEADAQLAYLIHNDLVYAVITEDSDLLAYGCSRVLFKLDKTGKGMEIRLADLYLCQELYMRSWTVDMFLQMCILSGCDFLPNIPRLGIKHANKIVDLVQDKDTRNVPALFRMIRANPKFNVPENYEQEFMKAFRTFRHHRVYDPRSRGVVFLNALPEEYLQDCDSYLGPYIEADIAEKIARGEIDPISKEQFRMGSPAEMGSNKAFQNLTISSDRPRPVVKAAKPPEPSKPYSNVLPKSQRVNYIPRPPSAPGNSFKPPRPSSSTAQDDRPLSMRELVDALPLKYVDRPS